MAISSLRQNKNTAENNAEKSRALHYVHAITIVLPVGLVALAGAKISDEFTGSPVRTPNMEVSLRPKPPTLSPTSAFSANLQI